jgi:hypothetical protein
MNDKVIQISRRPAGERANRLADRFDAEDARPRGCPTANIFMEGDGQ